MPIARRATTARRPHCLNASSRRSAIRRSTGTRCRRRAAIWPCSARPARAPRPDYPLIGDQLRVRRQALGLSLRDLADRLGVTPSLISQIERDRANPSVSTLYALVAELDTIRRRGWSLNDGERDPGVRLARAFALERAGGAGLADLVRALGSSRDADLAMAYIVEIGRPVVPGLASRLKDPDARVRERIAQTLGLIGGDEARAALEPTTKDPEVAVARAAERAIARIRLYEPAR